MAGNEVGSRDDHFQNWTTLITQQMNLVNIKQLYGLRELSVHSQYNTTTHSETERGEREREGEREGNRDRKTERWRDRERLGHRGKKKRQTDREKREVREKESKTE